VLPVQDGRVPRLLEVILVLLVLATVTSFGLRYAAWKVRSKLPGRSPKPERPRFSPVLFGLLTLVLVVAAIPMVAAVVHPSDGSHSRLPGAAILLVLLAAWLLLARSVLRPTR
jgi:heme/copper-type cytochrome/quinol oxidase subunit 3